MKIEQIIYDTTRGLLNVEDKLSIATLFLFCEKIGTKKLAELLYNDKRNTNRQLCQTCVISCFYYGKN